MTCNFSGRGAVSVFSMETGLSRAGVRVPETLGDAWGAGNPPDSPDSSQPQTGTCKVAGQSTTQLRVGRGFFDPSPVHVFGWSGGLAL